MNLTIPTWRQNLNAADEYAMIVAKMRKIILEIMRWSELDEEDDMKVGIKGVSCRLRRGICLLMYGVSSDCFRYVVSSSCGIDRLSPLCKWFVMTQ